MYIHLSLWWTVYSAVAEIEPYNMKPNKKLYVFNVSVELDRSHMDDRMQNIKFNIDYLQH